MAKRRLGKTSRAKNRLESNSVVKRILWPILIVVAATCVYLIWYINVQNSTYTNIEYIKGFLNQSGNLNDFQNKLGMHDPETDIKWYKTDKEIKIEFGRIVLTWEPADFYKQENLDHLEQIGITAKVKKGSDNKKSLHLYYKGKEVERWVK